MTFHIDLTQKKNGTFLAEAREEETHGTGQPLRANPYRDAEAFRATLRRAPLETEAKSRLEQASQDAEGRPEMPVSCAVSGVGPEHLRTIGLN